MSSDRLAALLDAAVDAIVLIDPRGHVTRFNRAAEHLFGYTAAEVLGRNVKVLMPAPDHDAHDGYLARYRDTGERRIIGIGREVMARRRDGTTFPIELSVGEFLSGKDHGFVGILRDISARRDQESALRRNAEEMRLLFELAPAPMAVSGPAGHVLRANQACFDLLGCLPEELSQKRISDLIVEADRPQFLDAMRRLNAGADTQERELNARHRDGHAIPVLLYLACVRETTGEPNAFICEMIDRRAVLLAVHEAEQLRERLAHAGRLGLLGEMVSGIAHEVNQPLTAISNYAAACRRLLKSGSANPDELIEVLEKIARQAEHAGQVIRGLRAMVRRQDSEREMLDFSQLLDGVTRLSAIDLRFIRQRLRVDAVPELPPVLGDSVQIQQVLINLIRNALDAMRDSGQGEEVHVSIRKSDDNWVEIRVSDDGPGLPDTVRARLFDPFVTTKAQGMGLGLSICSSIVQAHSGELRYETAPGGGALFIVRLPTASEDREEQT